MTPHRGRKTLSYNLSYPPCCHTSLNPVKSPKHAEQPVVENREREWGDQCQSQKKEQKTDITCHHSVPLHSLLHVKKDRTLKQQL